MGDWPCGLSHFDVSLTEIGMEKLLSVTEVCRIGGWNRMKFWRMRNDGRFPAGTTVGKMTVWRERDLRELLPVAKDAAAVQS